MEINVNIDLIDVKPYRVNLVDSFFTFGVRGNDFRGYIVLAQEANTWKGPTMLVELDREGSNYKGADPMYVNSRLTLWYNGRSVRKEDGYNFVLPDWRDYWITWWQGGIALGEGSVYRQGRIIIETNWTTYLQPRYVYVYSDSTYDKVKFRFHRGEL